MTICSQLLISDQARTELELPKCERTSTAQNERALSHVVVLHAFDHEVLETREFCCDV